MRRLKVPQRKLEERLIAMRKHPNQTDIWLMGVNDNPQQDLRELLYHDRLNPVHAGRISSLKPGLVPVLTQTAAKLDRNVRESFLRRVSEMPVEAGLVFETGRDSMQVFYVLKSGEAATGPVSLSVPGPHMEKVLLLPLDGEERTDEQKQAESGAEAGGKPGANAGQQRYRQEHDRLAGAIGMGNIERGFKLLGRARELVVVVIGTGRAGSRIALRLDQDGVGADGALILVDPDFIEPSNLDGMIVAHKAVGLPKVVGVAGTIAGITGNAQVKCLHASLSDPEVLDVLRIADVLFTALDEAPARLAAAVVASRYHIVHIDVTGGLAWTENKQAVAGGEVRVFVPGSRGCLGCYDNYNWTEALRLLELSGEAERERRQGLNWHEQRPGSNAGVLLPVVGEASQCLWAILRGELKDSLWWHYHKDRQGRPVWSDWSSRHRFGSRKCAVCGKQSGLGDIIE